MKRFMTNVQNENTRKNVNISPAKSQPDTLKLNRIIQHLKSDHGKYIKGHHYRNKRNNGDLEIII